jgi:hypothetical protein
MFSVYVPNVCCHKTHETFLPSLQILQMQYVIGLYLLFKLFPYPKTLKFY